MRLLFLNPTHYFIFTTITFLTSKGYLFKKGYALGMHNGMRRENQG